MRPRVVVAAAAGALALGGCTVDLPASAPTCDNIEVLTLMAQAVPSATTLPCLDPLPDGWTVVDFQGETGRVRFTLSHPVAGHDALEVRFAATCDEASEEVAGGGELPTLQLPRSGDRARPSGDGDEIVVEQLDGGCVVRAYEFETDDVQDLRADLDAALSAIPRADVAARVRELSGGRLDLDAP